MIGKKIGVQATNEAVWNAFLKANDIDPSQDRQGAGAVRPDAARAGQVDGWFSFFTNEPNLLKLQGVPTHVLPARRLQATRSCRRPTSVQERHARRATATSSRRCLVAEIMGWHDNLKNPALGATLAANEVRQGPEAHRRTSRRSSRSREHRSSSPPTPTTNGLFTITDELIDENINTLALAGINITAGQAVRHVGARRGLRREPRPEDLAGQPDDSVVRFPMATTTDRPCRTELDITSDEPP